MPTLAYSDNDHDSREWSLAAHPETSDPPISPSPLSFSIQLILLALFLPPEASFFIGDLRLTLERLVLLLLTPFVLLAFVRKITSADYRFVASDIFVPLTSLWMFVGPSVVYGFMDSVKHTGPVVLEYIIPYLATRMLLTGRNAALSFLSWLSIIISLVALDGMLDTATGTYFTHAFFGNISGFHDYRYNEDVFRHGILRASGPIEHPILFGFVCAVGLLCALSLQIRWRRFCISACLLGVVASISSAPEQCVLMGFGLLTYGRMVGRLPAKWLLLSAIPASISVILFLSTKTPFGHIFDLMTINPETAYFRLYIWNVIGPAILENPYFAVLSGNYDYEGSVDSVWLVLALNYGLPCSILTAMSMLGSCSLPTKLSHASLSYEESQIGMLLGVIIFLIIFMGFTVHFWGPTWILVGLLIGARARLGELGQLGYDEHITDLPLPEHQRSSGCQSQPFMT
ncbi:MAG TPA: hypothetical protein VMI52_02000 [Acetobacteraceae bacterium]|nr:hypothetical protein [Acetobacteraceae bacterium]